MDLLIQLVIMLVLGAVVSLIAHHRGRSAVGWFFVGFFAGCIGLILVLVLPDLKVQQERERRLAAENRRLREQVRKERMVADQRHAEVAQRLGAHDAALGIDTAPVARELPGAATPDPSALEWWYVRDGARRGPLPLARFRELWARGEIDLSTKVWAAGMAQWTPLGDHPGLLEALDA